MHHHALTDARIDRSGELVGFGAEEGEGVGIPDLTTLRPVPWEPRLAQVFCSFYEERSGRIFDHDVRTNLIRLEARLRTGTSAEMRVGMEPEATLLKELTPSPSPAADALAFYDLASFAALEPVVLDMFDTCRVLGLEISHVDAEGSGQLEVNQAPQGPVAAADSIILFRQALSFIARRHGLTASFMPKLTRGSSGSGLHHHFSLVRAGSDESNSARRSGWRLPPLPRRTGDRRGSVATRRRTHLGRLPVGQLVQALLGSRTLGAVREGLRVQQPDSDCAGSGAGAGRG